MEKFLLICLVLTSTVHAAARSGSCLMGSGDNQVRLLMEIEQTAVQVSYEGSEEDITQCRLGTHAEYDYFIQCAGEVEDDNMLIRIKGTTGNMVDAEGDVIARLSRCRIR